MLGSHSPSPKQSRIRPLEVGRFAELPDVVLDLTDVDAAPFETVLEAIGAVASIQGKRLVTEDSETVENELLTPMLMQRKPAINFHFASTDA